MEPEEMAEKVAKKFLDLEVYIRERVQIYHRQKVGEALTFLRSAVGSWAEENSYEIDDDTTEVFFWMSLLMSNC